jgi:hypothetical protein
MSIHSVILHKVTWHVSNTQIKDLDFYIENNYVEMKVINKEDLENFLNNKINIF